MRMMEKIGPFRLAVALNDTIDSMYASRAEERLIIHVVNSDVSIHRI
jgi:hypothetical protein